MFRKEIKFIYDFNLNKVRKLGTYLTYEQMRKADIHPAILHYISAEIDYLIFEDRQKILKDSIFDYSGETISGYFSQIGEEVKKNKRFSIEYIAQLILHSSSFTVNYLARPRWALMKLIFEDDEHKSTTDIKQILNYVYYYGYLKKIITSYINRKKILSLNYTEFEDLLNKIDDLGFQSDFNAILESALHSMADYFNMGETRKNMIPIQSVELFLREKNMQAHLVKLRDEFPQGEKLVYDLNDYKKVFSSIHRDVPEEFEDMTPEIVEEEKLTVESEDELIEEEIKYKEPISDDIDTQIKIDDKDARIEDEFEQLQQIGAEHDSDEEGNVAASGVHEREEEPVTESENIYDEEPIAIEQEETLEQETEDRELDETEGAEVNETDAEEEYEYSTEQPVDTETDEIIEPIEEEEVSTERDQEIVSQPENVEVEDKDNDDFEAQPDETEDVLDENVGNEEITRSDIFEDDETEVVEELVLDDSQENDDELILVEENLPDVIEPAEEQEDHPKITGLELDEESEALIYDPVFEDEADSDNDRDFEETEEEDKKADEEIEKVIEGEKLDSDEFIDDELSLFGSFDEIDNKPSLEETEPIEEPEADEEIDTLQDEKAGDGIENEVPIEDSPISGNEDVTETEEEIESELEEDFNPTSEETKIEVSELLERKNMTKVIEVIFDYDIEEFAYFIDSACTKDSEREAMAVVEKLIKNNNISPTSKEAETLKSIITDFYNRKEK